MYPPVCALNVGIGVGAGCGASVVGAHVYCAVGAWVFVGEAAGGELVGEAAGGEVTGGGGVGLDV